MVFEGRTPRVCQAAREPCWSQLNGMPSAEVPRIIPKLIISPYSDRVPRISMFMEATHWSCTAESVVMMRTHNADSGFCYTHPGLPPGKATVMPYILQYAYRNCNATDLTVSLNCQTEYLTFRRPPLSCHRTYSKPTSTVMRRTLQPGLQPLSCQGPDNRTPATVMPLNLQSPLRRCHATLIQQTLQNSNSHLHAIALPGSLQPRSCH